MSFDDDDDDDDDNNNNNNNNTGKAWGTSRESTKSRNYRKQPYWSLHTYFGPYYGESTKRLSWEITVHVPWIV